MLISEIRDEMVKEVGEDSADTTVLALILTCIKGAIRRFAAHSRTRRITTTASLSLAINTNYASLPSDFITERKGGVYYKSGDKSVPIIKMDVTEYNQLNTTIKGNPSYYWIIDDTMYFDKTAEAAKTIYCDHFKDESDVALGDTFYGTANEIEVIKDGAKYTYYSDYAEDAKKDAEKLALFKMGLDDADAKFMEEELPTHVEES